MRRPKRPPVVLLVLAALAIVGWLLSRARGGLVVHEVGTTPAPYGWVEYLPPSYDGTARVPLVIFLHGAKGRGDGHDPLSAVTTHPPMSWIRWTTMIGRVPGLGARGAAFVAPQSPGEWDAEELDAFLDHLLEARAIDPDRVYLTGVSMGGAGAWHYAAAHADRLAALMPVCGAAAAEPGDGARFGPLPVRAFHAFDDDVIPNDFSATWVAAIAAARGGQGESPMQTYPAVDGGAATGDVTTVFSGTRFSWEPVTAVPPATPLSLTVYRAGGHMIMARVYGEDANWYWLFAQRRPAH